MNSENSELGKSYETFSEMKAYIIIVTMSHVQKEEICLSSDSDGKGVNGVMSFSLGMILAVFMIGVIMLLVEIFVTGFGIFGVLGIGAVLASLIMAGATVGQVGLAVGLAVFLSLAAGFWAYRRIKSNQSLLWRGLILTDSTSSEKGYLSHQDKEQLRGKVGLSLTPLRPAGTIEIDGNRVDAVTEGSFISSGEQVVVQDVTHGRVIVRVQKTKEESLT